MDRLSLFVEGAALTLPDGLHHAQRLLRIIVNALADETGRRGGDRTMWSVVAERIKSADLPIARAGERIEVQLQRDDALDFGPGTRHQQTEATWRAVARALGAGATTEPKATTDAWATFTIGVDSQYEGRRGRFLHTLRLAPGQPPAWERRGEDPSHPAQGLACEAAELHEAWNRTIRREMTPRRTRRHR